MNLGKTISQLRIDKNVSIKNLCGDRLSRSAYTRFVNGETDTSAVNFLYFLDQLHVTFNEFMFIHNDYKLPNVMNFQIQLQQAYHSEDINKLIALENECENLSTYAQDKFHLLALFSRILQYNIQNQPIDSTILTPIQEYLSNVDTWTSYEITLFTNSMFIYNIEFVDTVVPRILKGLDKYQLLRDYTNESFSLLVNLLTFYIQHKQIDKANNIFKTISSINLPEDFIKEKLYLIYFQGIMQLVLQQNLTGHLKISQVFTACDLLHLETIKQSLHRFYIMVCSLYNITPSEDIELSSAKCN